MCSSDLKKSLLSLVLVFAASCSTEQTLPELQQPELINAQATKNTAQLHNKDFARKLDNIKNYKFSPTNSICGPKNEMQDVNAYDGKLGQTVEFVKAHQGPVGAMESKNIDSSSKFCSGTLIGDDLYLTASHCVDGSTVGKFVAFDYEVAKAGTKALKPQVHHKIVKVEEEGAKVGLDYAILRLEGKPGEKFGFTKINTDEPTKGLLTTIIQHPSGNPKKVEVGNVATIEDVYLSYSELDTEPGSSGSGVLDDKGKVYAVHTNGGCYSSGGANRGVKMSTIIKKSNIIRTLYIQQVELPPVPQKNR